MENTSSEKYDQRLKNIEHYTIFPSLIPFIGESYGKLKDNKLLLIAESHYFPEKARIHYTAKKWYDSTYQDLTNEEIYYINTREVLETEWNTKSDIVFREINSTIEPFSNTINSRAMNSVAFMNCFQRPGKEGKSIRHSCEKLDIEVALETVNSVIQIIKPTIVIFYSKFSWDNVGWKLAEIHQDINFEFSCHPATGGHYWHSKNYIHNKDKIQKYLNDKMNN